MVTAKNKGLARDLDDCFADGAAPDARASAVLREALASRDQALVVQAAKLVATHTSSELEQASCAAYDALCERPGSDPGCLAKEALLAALDALEHVDAERFARASRYVQHESGKGRGRDSGGRVRARAVLALARLGHPDLLVMLGARLGDEDATVRLAAARALGHREQRDGAGLLLLKLASGDAEPQVLSEALRALFVLASDHAPDAARRLLAQGGVSGELTLQALGTAAHDAAVALLEELLTERALASERREVIDALGLSLRPRARESLLQLVRSGSRDDAEAALSALSIHRYDPRLVEQVREASAHSSALRARVAALF